MRRKLHSWLRDEHGFTLVELLVTLALLALIVIPLLSLVTTNARDTLMARSYLQATYLAQTRIEELRATPYSAIVPEPAASVPGSAIFTRSVAVVEQQTALEQRLGMPARLKRVTVTVAWDGGAHSVVLASLISGGQTP